MHQEELLKSSKWSSRSRDVQDKIRRVWEERGADYERLQREFEVAEAAQQDKIRQRREMAAAQALVFCSWVVKGTACK